MKRYFFFLIFLYSLSYSQTVQQKNKAYKNFESKCRATTLKGIPKPEWVDKETYFKSAVFYPVHIVDYNPKTNKTAWIIDTNKFLVIYNDNLTYFIDSVISDYHKSFDHYNVQNKFASLLLTMNNTSGNLKVGYLTDEYYPATGAFPNLLLIEDTKLTDKDHIHSNIEDVISSHYASQEDFLLQKEISVLRRNLQSSQIIKGIRSYFRSFEYYCPKDTALVINKFIENIDIGSNGLTKIQKELILKEISKKIDIRKNEESTGKKDFGNFSLYNIDFSDFMRKTLNSQQLSSYEEYMNIHFPEYVHKQYGRYLYGDLKLIDSKQVRDTDDTALSLPYFNEFVKQQLTDCGCGVESKGFRLGTKN
ncbi:hypothetical protein MKJ01_05865 [Chryseobacterium sp. SSA4.19]|uniref:hypothetical protein n=1 Tax=Chryseobacterium sp. SSA4.19 TaxID=2919915 RepID=UPI001F4DDEC8|nr:hypothetical protein [Chryseobacterium sp. SSA4.19]MCJ8153286.1 hypothetical protein [Chryseobacterium sp. SSA4.19]